MYYVLVILLHRPFVADGHLYSTSRFISVDSFMKCASAASSISSLLRSYHRAFSIRRAPYLISYATYVAATVHTRIAARRGNDSTAHANLATCLAVFQENKETNSAVQKAAMIVQSLMTKHGVGIASVSNAALETEFPGALRDQELSSSEARAPPKPASNFEAGRGPNEVCAASQRSTESIPVGGADYSPSSDWVDIDGIIQSFLQEDTGGTKSHMYHTPGQPPGTPWIPQQRFGQSAPESSATQPAPAARDLYSGGGDVQDTAYHGYQWQQGWRTPNPEPASLEDPLFGFNGSALDAFPFLCW